MVTPSASADDLVKWAAVLAAADPRSFVRLREGNEFSAITAMSDFAVDRGPVVGTGIGVSAGIGVGLLVCDVDAALDAIDRGEPIVYARHMTSPVDEPILRAAAGVITASGGHSSHAAVVARSFGVPCVCGVDALVLTSDGARFGGVEVPAGSMLMVDGDEGTVRRAQLASAQGGGSNAIADADAERVAERVEREVVIHAARQVLAGRVRVMANTDDAQSARQAAEFGAAGVGLCRSEQFFIGALAKPIRDLVDGCIGEQREAALVAVSERCEQMLTAIADVVSPSPITVRLLDAPLHELAVTPTDPAAKPATGMSTDMAATIEQNPMMGMRGVRLGVIDPDLLRAQIDGLWRAARRHPNVHTLRVLVPMVSDASEVNLVAQLCAEAISHSPDEPTEPGQVTRFSLGAMIETPRAALTAGKFAAMVDFVSFGTNDLTQFTWGLSRDDSTAVFLDSYKAIGAFEHNPFVGLDRAGVGALIRFAINELRRVNPTVELAACGEHCADPESVAMLVEAGITSISCASRFVESAQVAAAQALVGANPHAAPVSGTHVSGTHTSGTAGVP